MPTGDPPDEALARAVCRLRKDSGITQEHLAYRAGLTTASLARIERGRSTPAWTTVGRIACALDVSLVEFVVAVEDACER
jgi:transcriptional regulator with XRE-family HTH domain